MIIMLIQLPPDTTTVAFQLTRAVEGMSERILSYAIPLAAVGALAMAIVEALKKLTNARTRFHARRWTDIMLPPDMKPDVMDKRRLAYAQLLQLCTGATMDEAAAAVIYLEENRAPARWGGTKSSPAYAVFAQETTAMTGMIQDSVDVALAAVPTSYTELFNVMVEGANVMDIDTWLQRNDDKAKAKDPLAAQERSNTHGRLRQIARRRIDGFAVYALQRWATNNQIAGNVVGFLVMAVAMATIASNNASLQGRRGVAAVYLLCLGGGLLAPVAKDLVSALKKVKEQ